MEKQKVFDVPGIKIDVSHIYLAFSLQIYSYMSNICIFLVAVK